MAFSRTAPRHEITYLRRRPKVGEKPPAPATGAGAKAPAPSLSLKRDTQPKLPAAKVKRVEGRAILTADAPTVSLTRLQSAVGSLAFDVAGAGELACAWELADGEAGLVSAAADVLVSPQFGRRAIVQLYKDRLVVGLRHVRELRRLLLLASGLQSEKPSRVVGELHGGATIESAHTAVAAVVVALALYQVDGELVVRREDFGFDTSEAAAAAYGFSLTWLPPVQR